MNVDTIVFDFIMESLPYEESPNFRRLIPMLREQEKKDQEKKFPFIWTKGYH